MSNACIEILEEQRKSFSQPDKEALSKSGAESPAPAKREELQKGCRAELPSQALQNQQTFLGLRPGDCCGLASSLFRGLLGSFPKGEKEKKQSEA